MNELQLISEAEQLERSQLEETIASKYESFAEIGAALLKIRDSKLYRNTHTSFEEYLKEVWHKSKSTGYQLMWAAEATAVVEGIGEPPKNEAQARPLTKLKSEPELQQIAWQEAQEVAINENRKVTAADVSAIVDSYQGKVFQLYPYLGSKCNLSKVIANFIKQHSFKRYVEPFMGSAAVYIRFFLEGMMDNLDLIVLNDLDSEVANYVKILRSRTEELAEAIRLTPYDQSEAMSAMTDLDKLDELERARKFIIQKVQNIAGSNNAGFVRDEGRVKKWNSYPDKLPEMRRILEPVLFENMDCQEVIKKYASADTFFYVDPPYVDHETDYRTHFFQHGALAELLTEIPSAGVIVSYYDHPQLFDLYPADKWHWERRTIIKSSGRAEEGKPQATELILIRKDKCKFLVRLDNTQKASEPIETPSFAEWKSTVSNWNLTNLKQAGEIIESILINR